MPILIGWRVVRSQIGDRIDPDDGELICWRLDLSI
jgi:hypothetical protein